MVTSHTATQYLEDVRFPSVVDPSSLCLTDTGIFHFKFFQIEIYLSKHTFCVGLLVRGQFFYKIIQQFACSFPPSDLKR